MRVALVGMSVLSEPDPDERPLLAALRAAGGEAEVIAWDSQTDPAHDPAAFDVCLLRATWNYHLKPDAYARWIERATQVSVLLNPARAVRWNMHKRYLVALAEAGVETIPTLCLESGSEFDLPRTVVERGWSELVIKPAVACGSWHTYRFGPDETAKADALLRDMLTRHDMLIQPFVPEFGEPGELAIVWIDGKVTHAVRKAPRYHGGDESVSAAPALSDRHIAFAEKAIDASGQDVMYARVDVIERADDILMLSELEMIEPSLFFDYSAESLERFVEAVMRLGRGLRLEA